MKTLDVRDLAMKLFGVYSLITFIVCLPSVLSSIFLSEETTTQKWTYGLLASVVPILYGVCAYLCIMRTSKVVAFLWRSPDSQQLSSADTAEIAKSSFWIKLIGVFYFISSSAAVMSQLYMLAAANEPMGSYWQYRNLSQILILLVSILCIFKSQQIDEFLKAKSK